LPDDRLEHEIVEPETKARYIRSRLISGLFVLVPVWVTIVVIGAAFGAMSSLLSPLVRMAPWTLSPLAERSISVAAFVLLVFLCGAIASRMLGRRLLAWAESIILHVPVVKSIYSASKQVVDAISLTNKAAFKSVVLVEYPRPGLRAVGFVTGVSSDATGRRWCRVFIPAAPPTSGFLELVPIEEVQATDMTVEQGLKMVVSGGFIAPDHIATHPFREET